MPQLLILSLFSHLDSQLNLPKSLGVHQQWPIEEKKRLEFFFMGFNDGLKMERKGCKFFIYRIWRWPKEEKKRLQKNNCGIQHWPKEKKKRLQVFFHEFWPW